jgi:hypothetical protein
MAPLELRNIRAYFAQGKQKRGTCNGWETNAVFFPLRIDYVMQAARTRWAGLSPEDRIVVARAFEDAIEKPYLVGDYKLSFRNLSTGKIIAIHEFRVGFIGFVIFTAGQAAILFDFSLDQDIGLAAE